MGVHIEQSDEQLLISSGKMLKGVNINTLVYPGFPTDLQQPFTTLLTKATGRSIVTDTIYSGRLKHIDELRRMNANIREEDGSAFINGMTPLEGAMVKASDIRADASLDLADLLDTILNY